MTFKFSVKINNPFPLRLLRLFRLLRSSQNKRHRFTLKHKRRNSSIKNPKMTRLKYIPQWECHNIVFGRLFHFSSTLSWRTRKVKAIHLPTYCRIRKSAVDNTGWPGVHKYRTKYACNTDIWQARALLNGNIWGCPVLPGSLQVLSGSPVFAGI